MIWASKCFIVEVITLLNNASWTAWSRSWISCTSLAAVLVDILVILRSNWVSRVEMLDIGKGISKLKKAGRENFTTPTNQHSHVTPFIVNSHKQKISTISIPLFGFIPQWPMNHRSISCVNNPDPPQTFYPMDLPSCLILMVQIVSFLGFSSQEHTRFLIAIRNRWRWTLQMNLVGWVIFQ